VAQNSNEQTYYARRAETERARALAAQDERVRWVHHQLAEEYRVRALLGVANDG
jgi:hypothetical protein